MKTINIQGRPYVMVVERLKEFRENKDYEGWSIETDIHHVAKEWVLLRAIIRDTEGRIRATGTAQEEAGKGTVNKTSHVENCETSAWGRALACLGIGLDAEGIASAEEMALARDADLEQVNNIEDLLRTSTFDEDGRQKIESEIATLTFARAEKCISYLLANQIPQKDMGSMKQKDIHKELDLKMQNERQ